jgi:hypothetical protein
MHATGPQRQVQTVGLELAGIRGDIERQSVDHYRQRFTTGAAQPVDRKHWRSAHADLFLLSLGNAFRGRSRSCLSSCCFFGCFRRPLRLLSPGLIVLGFGLRPTRLPGSHHRSQRRAIGNDDWAVRVVKFGVGITQRVQDQRACSPLR